MKKVAVEDIEIGLEHGYVMKLLGLSEFDGKELEISVEPTFLPQTHQLAAVHDAMNAVFVNGNAVEETMFYGPGAVKQGQIPDRQGFHDRVCQLREAGKGD